MVQNTLRSRPGSIGCDLNKELPSPAVPICNYLAILAQLGARTALHIALPPRRAGARGLIDSESSHDGVLLSAYKEQVGDALHTRHHIAPHRYHEDPLAGKVPRDTTLSPSQAYRATQTSNRQHLRLRARNTGRQAQQ